MFVIYSKYREEKYVRYFILEKLINIE